MQSTTRRHFLRASLAVASLLPSARALTAPITWSVYPFTLSVASA